MIISLIKNCKEEKEYKFFVNKWTKKNEKIDYLLGICGSSLSKIDTTTLKPITSYYLMHLKAIYTVKDHPTIFLLEFKSNRVQYFVSKDIHDIIETIQKLLISLSFEKVEPVEISEQEAQSLRERASFKDISIIKKHLLEKIKNTVRMINLF